ncbi:MAG TPA: hypothetical protein VLH77_07295 [Gammaproteobacteria bacterium]|nr:hypothetical protein [Gammaproteobacteria bacterium]
MQLSQKGILLGLITLAATPAVEAVTAKQAAVYSAFGLAGVTLAKYCYTDPEKFQEWKYTEAPTCIQDKIQNAVAYWANEIAGHDKMEFEMLGYDGMKPLFKPKVKGRGWVYFLKKLWKPTDTFIKVPATVAAALIAIKAAPYVFKDHADRACNYSCR